MAINLNKYKDSLLAAWKDVLDEKTATDWALFGYEGQTFDLKVMSKGAGGIEELIEDLNSGKIMYAFCKVIDPKTSLPKCVLINWQGEGAPLGRKGTCANHIRDISNFFKGVHVTINARNEEEVDPQLIVDKLAKSTGSAYSFKERTEYTNDSGPVGTTYKKVIPTQEINARERDKFWEKEEQEEKLRQQEERKRKEEERARLENERKQRELEETALREQRIKERTHSITKLREAEKTVIDRQKENIPSSNIDDPEAEDLERRKRSDMLRRQRSQEAQAVISTRTIDARAVFEKNTSAGQMQTTRRSSFNQSVQHVTTHSAQHVTSVGNRKVSLPSWPPNNDNVFDEHNDKINQNTDTITTTYHSNEQQQQNVSSPILNQNMKFGNNHQEQLLEEEEQNWNIKTEKQQPVIQEALQVAEIVQEEQLITNNGDGELNLDPEDMGLMARALYDYQAADSTEITFDPGDIITHIDQIDEGWWQGLGPDGTYGLFPANYVELISQ